MRHLLNMKQKLYSHPKISRKDALSNVASDTPNANLCNLEVLQLR